jgi:hypothetical protein
MLSRTISSLMTMIIFRIELILFLNKKVNQLPMPMLILKTKVKELDNKTRIKILLRATVTVKAEAAICS